jgi:major membrane immunogen (membrane-anchored lipoprotein)
MTNTRSSRFLIFLLFLCLLLAGCSKSATTTTQPLADGTYRGYYADHGMTQLGLEFTVTDGVFSEAHFLQLCYKDGDYLSENATTSQQNIRTQFEQLLTSLIGQGEEGIRTLYTPQNIAEDIDAVSAATLKSGKLVYAIHDALLRGNVSEQSSSDVIPLGFYDPPAAAPRWRMAPIAAFTIKTVPNGSRCSSH